MPKTHNGETYLRIGEVAKELERTVRTIVGWYDWAEENNAQSDLPEVFRLDKRGTRFFKETDIEQLKNFRDNIKYGMMAEMNRKRWGERGKQIES